MCSWQKGARGCVVISVASALITTNTTRPVLTLDIAPDRPAAGRILGHRCAPDDPRSDVAATPHLEERRIGPFPRGARGKTQHVLAMRIVEDPSELEPVLSMIVSARRAEEVEAVGDTELGLVLPHLAFGILEEIEVERLLGPGIGVVGANTVGLTPAPQHQTPALIFRISAPSAGGGSVAGFAIRTRFADHPDCSAKTRYALRLKPDHSIGSCHNCHTSNSTSESSRRIKSALGVSDE